MKPLKRLRNKIFGLINPGNKAYCLYCKKSYGRFIHEGAKYPIFKKYKIAGGGYKLNVKCPNCGSVDRSRLLYLFFQLRTNVFKQPTKILHISPNKEIANVLTGPTITQIVGSIEPEQYAEYNSVYLDVQKMDLKDNEFDVVICCHVLEHVDNDQQAMREIYRVLKPGGFAVLQVPFATDLNRTLEDKTLTSDKQRKLAFGQKDHVRLYGLDYLDRLKSAGFRMDLDNPFRNKWLPYEELQKHRLDPIEDVIVARKD
jgi:SAM-dependent methyltransferase